MNDVINNVTTTKMPRSHRYKSLKSICVDTVLFFALFALVGHLTINFWERYTIQHELSSMKNSLHILKNTVTSIGKTYDNLHTDLKDLFKMVKNKEPQTPQCVHTKPDVDSIWCKNQCKTQCMSKADRKKLHELQVQAVLLKPKTKDVGTMNDVLKEFPNRKNKSTEFNNREAATNTRNPTKSTGITSEMSNYETEEYQRNYRRYPECNNRHRCVGDTNYGRCDYIKN